MVSADSPAMEPEDRPDHGETPEEGTRSFMPGPPDPSMTLGSFVVCRDNFLALQMACIVAAGGPREAFSGLLCLYGSHGVGKTHILSAIANLSGRRTSLLVNVRDLGTSYDAACGRESLSELTQRLIAPDILLLDDMEACADRYEFQEWMASIISERLGSGRDSAVSSVMSPLSLQGVGKDLAAVLRQGTALRLRTKGTRAHAVMMREFCRDLGVREKMIRLLCGFTVAEKDRPLDGAGYHRLLYLLGYRLADARKRSFFNEPLIVSRWSKSAGDTGSVAFARYQKTGKLLIRFG
jgi:chromosomal replication initiation ATPase DnaA